MCVKHCYLLLLHLFLFPLLLFLHPTHGQSNPFLFPAILSLLLSQTSIQCRTHTHTHIHTIFSLLTLILHAIPFLGYKYVLLHVLLLLFICCEAKNMMYKKTLSPPIYFSPPFYPSPYSSSPLSLSPHLHPKIGVKC